MTNLVSIVQRSLLLLACQKGQTSMPARFSSRESSSSHLCCKESLRGVEGESIVGVAWRDTWGYDDFARRWAVMGPWAVRRAAVGRVGVVHCEDRKTTVHINTGMDERASGSGLRAADSSVRWASVRVHAGLVVVSTRALMHGGSKTGIRAEAVVIIVSWLL